ncbi:hypothetical protein DFA_01306 [Cavenderia fasciculata]|uniref:PH domain-containing protein n=1 Tax=Cavenderia fasciculata TaxID=261658 RepID=F4PS39_CACFS|nr:uncharacterized protein DFA_01306 [Cavenderia fasciculata]EGG21422.1 hypothetical protein DFA_01306 [Cavenderia fasciculata]|eukprot:XP_004359272.1 hypothetical protein DFA_01306 [Cavenderia fasciculata]
MLIEGSVFKLGNKGLIKTFKKRYFIVPENQDIIYYYESKIERKQCGSIKLRDILHVGTSKDTTATQGQFHFDITGRIYKLYTLTEKERSYWIDSVTTRLDEIKKRDDETKVKTNEMLRDLKIYTSYDGNQESDYDDESSIGSSYTPSKGGSRGGAKNLERELELKDDEISKLQEEKMAFENYVKELEDEKCLLQKENEKLIERFDESSIDLYQATIRDLETKREEMENDLNVMSKHLDEERSLRTQAIKDRDLLERTMGDENSQLVLKTEELESQKKKALELISSGTMNIHHSGGGSKQQTTKNWSQFLIQIERNNFKYRKQRDTYYLDNIKLKKKIDEHILIDRESSLKNFEDMVGRLIQFEMVYRSQELEEIYPTIFDEIQCINNFLNKSSVDLYTTNEPILFGFIDTYTPKIASIIANVNNHNNSTSSLPDMSNDMIKSELQEPVDVLLSHTEKCKQQSLTMTLDRVEPFSLKIQAFTKTLEKAKATLQDYRLKLAQLKSDTLAFPVHPECIDPFENRVESIVDKIEPHIIQHEQNEDQEIILDDPKQLINKINDLEVEFKAKIQYYEGEKKKTETFLSSLERMSVGVEMALEQISIGSETDQVLVDLEVLYNEKVDLVERTKRGVLDLTVIKRKAQLIKKLEELQAEASLKYTANEDDILDVMVGSVIDSFVKNKPGQQDKKEKDTTTSTTVGGNKEITITGVIPPNFERLGEGLYLFGTKKINVQILAGGIVVRVGGGFEAFSSYVLKFGRSETIKLLRQQQQITTANSKTTTILTSVSTSSSSSSSSTRQPPRPISRAATSRAENRKSLVLSSNSLQPQTTAVNSATITSTITVMSSPKQSNNRSTITTPITNRMSRSLSKGVIQSNRVELKEKDPSIIHSITCSKFPPILVIAIFGSNRVQKNSSDNCRF